MRITPIILFTMFLAVSVFAQQDSPRVIRFSGQVPSASVEDQTVVISFSLFRAQQNGTPLWTETQQVVLKDGKFSVLLGSTPGEGLPVGVFASTDARWLEWQIAGEVPAARVQLVSVPYAMSSANAESFAGHSIEEFVLATPAAKNSVETGRAQREGSPVPTGTGQANMLAKFNGVATTISSQVYDDGSSVGIGTLAPGAKLEVAGDMKISGAGSALVLPDGTRIMGRKDLASPGVRFADQFADGSQTGGIAEAYADCPATGCKVELGQDVNITSPQVITVANNKPLTLDLAGRVIRVSNTTGIGLTFTSENINARTPLTVMNGSLTCSWTQPNLTGYAWRRSVNVSIENLNVVGCNTAGSLAVL